MAKKLFLTAFAVLFILTLNSCQRDKMKADIPAYLSIPAVNLVTNYNSEGTSHNDISTVWIFANNKPVGVFELPCVVPVLANGPTEIEVQFGINMNGISATRAIYLAYNKYEQTLDMNPQDTIYLDPSKIVNVSYKSTATVKVIEDFDETGQNLVATGRSDTALLKTSQPNEIFINTSNLSENNGKAGIAHLTSDNPFFEASTIDIYQLPRVGQSVFLEMSYKTDVPILIGVIAHRPEGKVQAGTLTLYASDSWKKIYVNLVTEIDAYPTATGFQIFIGGSLGNSLNSADIQLDNLKLVY